MGQPLTATELRAKLYRVLDQVVATGIPQEVRRGEHTLLILPADPPRHRLGDLPKHEVLACSVEELIATSWQDAWDRNE